MAQPSPIRPQVHFGPFAADLRTGELFKSGIRIRLQVRPFAVLAMLLEHPGEVITRDEIRVRLWPDGTFVDFDHNISSAVGKLRAALADTAVSPRYIETVGRGYRFVAEIAVVPAKPLAESTPPVGEMPAGPEATPIGAAAVPYRRFWAWLVFAACVVVGVGSVAYSTWSRGRAELRAAPARIMLAVLPFDNLTGDPGQDYLSDGLTEEMITQLGSVDSSRLGVIARTSVMRYKNSRVPLGQIGSDLGVQYVLEGSVRREADNLRITAQLIQVRDQTHVWAREYNRELKDLLNLQSEIAQEIGPEIRTAVGDIKPRASAPLPPAQHDYEAYETYLKGEYFLDKRTVPDFRKAIDYFRKATERDPHYARAYAGLADCYALLGGYSSLPQVDFVANARAAAVQALEIDEQLPEAHTALAVIVQNYDWDWQTAEKGFRRAIALNPNYATAHHWYAEHLMWRGRFQQALDESEKARLLDPLSLIVAADRGAILYYSRQYEPAIRQFRSVLDLDPNFPRASMIMYAYVEEGMFPQALAAAARNRVHSEPWYWADLAYIHGRAGHLREAREDLGHLQRLSRKEEVDPALFAYAFLGIGDKQAALRSLDRACDAHSNIMTSLKVEPAFDSLRSDPSFQDLLRRVGLSQ
jgi:TolB-like protein/DNA-binding winged helix-turn-helix (wHTH) protein/Tfp pilus assembly protein PilF